MGKHRGGRASSVAERRTRTAQAVRQPRPPKPTKPLSATARKTLVTKQLVQALGPCHGDTHKGPRSAAGAHSIGWP